MSTRLARIHAITLSALLGLFLIRVFTQLSQAFWPTDVLPRFEAWHSGTLPYPVLVLSQIAIIALLVWLVRRFWRAEPIGGVRVQVALWIIASLYLAGSILRFVAGLTFASQNAFMAAHLPAFFHIVLALAVTVIASYASLKAEPGARA